MTALETFVRLGEDFDVDESIQLNLESLTCMLYGARYDLFRMGKFSDAALPPNKDCLLQHIQRASYQAAIWKRAIVPIIDTPSPTNHGWNIDEEGNIGVLWMTKKCAPDVLLKDCNCKCKTGCSTLRCSCKKAITSVMICASALDAQIVHMNPVKVVELMKKTCNV